MSNDLWDLGGYLPFAYKVTPWTTLFPNLGKHTKQNTLANLYIAKLYTFYLTRLQFHQYLTFLGAVGENICKNSSILFDADAYKGACGDLLRKISDAVAGGTVNDEAFHTIVTDFEASLQTKVDDRQFFSDTVYNVFFENYAYFTDCAYGFVYTFGQQYSVAVGDHKGFKPVPQPFAVLPMLADAMRHYPVITCDGHLSLCYYAPNGAWGAPLAFKFDYPTAVENGFEYIYPEDSHEMRFYKVGLKQVPRDFSGKIRGSPLLYDLPFDLVEAFAKPSDG